MDPIKCFSCGKVLKPPVSNGEEEGGLVAVRNMSKEDKELFFKKHRYVRLCCKRMFLSPVNFNNILLKYGRAESTLNKDGTITRPYH
jgi:DNA-directed RNA polymerase subunit N (RpoN/RPB10)